MKSSSAFSLLLLAFGIASVGETSAQAMTQHKGKVLVVVSAADSIPLREGRPHPTGIFIGEITEPAQSMREAGYDLVYATPGGRVPTIDQDSIRGIYWRWSKSRVKEAHKIYAELLEEGLKNPLRLEDLASNADRLKEFDAVFVPGGHGPLVDLYYRDIWSSKELNSDMGKVLAYFHAANKPTGLICHAPAVLATAPRVNGKWIYQGYKITAISRFTEWLNEDAPLFSTIDGHVDLYPSNILKAAGAKYVASKIPSKPFVVEDRELMTGQDPFSARLMGKRFTQKLNRYMENKAKQK
jgi:putative intracellular protease/amidase